MKASRAKRSPPCCRYTTNIGAWGIGANFALNRNAKSAPRQGAAANVTADEVATRRWRRNVQSAPVSSWVCGSWNQPIRRACRTNYRGVEWKVFMLVV